jgi:hypothetical protein
MHMHNTNGNGSAIAAPRVRVLNGRGIAHRRPNKRRRAVLAAELADGHAIVQLSIGQLAGLFGVSRTYIDKARKLTPEMRREILVGPDSTAFRPFLSPPVPRFPSPALAGIPSDESLAVLAHRVGPDRWLAAGVRAQI